MYTAGPQMNEGNASLQGAMADIMARTSTKAALLTSIDTNNYNPGPSVGASEQKAPGVSHKRSVSDGNTIF